MKTTEDYRTKIERLYRGWQFCWLPGYEYYGQRQEAYCRWRPSRAGRYWSFVLNYGQLDNWVPFDGVFEMALERVGPDDVGKLFGTHETEFSHTASLWRGGWRWWDGRGLSESFVYTLRDLLVDRYAKARGLYESWPLDLNDPYNFAIPEATLSNDSAKNCERTPGEFVAIVEESGAFPANATNSTNG